MLTCHDIQPSVDLAGGLSTIAANSTGAPLEDPGNLTSVALGLPPGCPVDCPSRRLYHDLDVCCHDPSALGVMYGIGIPATMLYAFGIPIFAGALLYRARDNLDDTRVVATLGFLQEGYRRDQFYWEVVIMARKLIVVCIAVFLEPWGAAVQTYVAMTNVFAFTALHAFYQPFRDRDLNLLELFALISAFLTFVCGLFLFDSVTGDGVRVLATMVVVLLNTTVIAVALVALLLPFAAPYFPLWCGCRRIDRGDTIAKARVGETNQRRLPIVLE